jgi:hypothetical protein
MSSHGRTIGSKYRTADGTFPENSLIFMGEVPTNRVRQSDNVHKYLLTKETGIYKFTYRLKNIGR